MSGSDEMPGAKSAKATRVRTRRLTRCGQGRPCALPDIGSPSARACLSLCSSMHRNPRRRNSLPRDTRASYHGKTRLGITVAQPSRALPTDEASSIKNYKISMNRFPKSPQCGSMSDQWFDSGICHPPDTSPEQVSES
ncbi:hypothetical protein KL86PLE_130254 [uncultured Pleomorphomonas sp.]|uniref:Uncharacterized protein n=1 Tax=uncultured Pleomorphomonas sp. TaxID=442121 RepID=A0A212LAK3_9HYPH|nr:hypothetical protein KL86PLE_130254 [uncultured Pleomorphomonas sp.]